MVAKEHEIEGYVSVAVNNRGKIEITLETTIENPHGNFTSRESYEFLPSEARFLSEALADALRKVPNA